jgi:hypothetical protein
MVATLDFIAGKRRERFIDNDVLVFVDETGQEELTDPKYPIFGLAGIATSVEQYRYVREGWISLKEKHFGGGGVKLHASELRNPSSEQTHAIGEFFREGTFFRFACVASKAGDASRTSYYAAVAESVASSLLTLPIARQAMRIALVREDSQRGEKLAKRYFQKFNAFTLMRPSEDGPDYAVREIPIVHVVGSKKLKEPGLEAADFVAQAAGKQTERGFDKDLRKDFDAVFNPRVERLSKYVHVNE